MALNALERLKQEKNKQSGSGPANSGLSALERLKKEKKTTQAPVVDTPKYIPSEHRNTYDASGKVIQVDGKDTLGYKASKFGDKAKTGFHNALASINTNYSNFIEKVTGRPDYEKNPPSTSVFKNTMRELPAAITETILPAVKAIRDDPETASQVTVRDLARETPKAVVDTGKQILKAPIKGAVELPNFVTAGAYQPEIKFNVPFLGEVTNSDYNIARRIEAGEDALPTVIQEKSQALLDILFFSSLAAKPFQGRPQTVATGVNKNVLPSGAESAGPKSFRLYEPSKPSVKAVDPKAVLELQNSGVKFKNPYNPEYPTFFKVTSDKGGALKGEIIQIRPSYFNTIKGKLRTGTIKSVPPEQISVLHETKTTPESVKNTIVKVKTPEVTATKVTTPTVPVAPSPVIPKITKYETVHQGGEKKIVDGEPVNIIKGVDTFIHKEKNGWVVSEKSTGRYLADGYSRDEAISNAKSNIKKVGIDKFNKLIQDNQLVKQEEAGLTLKPSTETTKEGISAEAQTVEAPSDKPVVNKTDIKTLINNSPEFKANPELKVTEIDGEKRLYFEGDKTSFSIKPEAMGLNPDKLDIGEIVDVDVKAFKATGAPQQLRVYKGDTAQAFSAKNISDPSSPVAKTEVKKIIKRSEIAKELSDKLNVPIRRGKFSHQGALGVFKPESKVVRLKKGGLPVLFHEVAHFLDSNFAFSKVIDGKERRALMEEYGHSYEGQPHKQRQEAFAEFTRFMMTGQETRAKNLAPKFYAEWQKKIETLPEIRDVIDTAKNNYQRWKEQPAVDKVFSNISLEENTNQSIKDRLSSSLHDLYTMGIDDLHPLDQFVKLAKQKGAKVSAETDPYVLARNTRGWIGKANQFLTKGTFGKKYWKEVDGKIVPDYKGKSLQDILKPVEEAGKLDDLRVYLVSKRVIELNKRDIMSGISVKDAKEAVAEIEKNSPEMEAVAKDIYKYQDDLLNFAKENGILGEEGFKKVKEFNQFRVPFYRVMEESNAAYMGGKKIGGNISSPIKKIKGSERDIIDPIESIIKDTYSIISAAERNNVGVALAKLSKSNFELGRLFEEVDQKKAPVSIKVEEVLKKVMGKEEYAELKSALPEDKLTEISDAIVTMFKPMQDRGNNMLTVNFGDKQKTFQVEPTLFKALQGLEAEDIGSIMKIIAMPARWLRAGATLSPEFMARNPIRDQFSAAIYSKYGYKMGFDLIGGLAELFKGGPVHQLWQLSGGDNSMLVSMDRNYLRQNLDDILASKGQKALKYVKNPIELLRALSELGEQATRLGEMKRALNKTKNPTEAGFASREVTLDFARIGTKTRAINSIIAFFNATMQGTDKMRRGFKTDPKGTLLRTLMYVTLPSILLYLVNRDDPRWDEIPQWQKDIFWIVMTEDNIYRIPKPFELGIIFGTIPERIMEMIDKNDPSKFEGITETVASGLTPSFIPTGMLPIIENITNHSFFLDRPIVGQSEENLPAGQQSSQFTSEIAKIIGEKANFSPAKIDNLIKGYTGGLGTHATNVIDNVLKGTGISEEVEEPTKGLESMPIIKAFIVRAPIGSSSESVNTVYNKYEDVSAKKLYMNRLIDQGQTVKAAQYAVQYPEIFLSPIYSDAVDQFSTFNKFKKLIRNSDKLTGDEKKEKIEILDTEMTRYAQETLKKAEEIGAELDSKMKQKQNVE